VTVVAVPRRLLGLEARDVTVAMDGPSTSAFRFRLPVRPADADADLRPSASEIEAPAVSLGDVPGRL